MAQSKCYEINLKYALSKSHFANLYSALFLSGKGTGRSLAHDQLEIFGSIERSLSSVGVEGRPCLLRFICEMHQRPIGRNSILGEVFDVVFS